MADRENNDDAARISPGLRARLRRLVRTGDAFWLGIVLLFFCIQFRETLLLNRHWLFADNSLQSFPWHYFVWESVREGGLTDPCPSIALGMPLFTEPQVEAFYPLNTAWWPISDPFVSYTLKLHLHILLMGLGMYVLARKIGRRPMASAGAAILVMGGSVIIDRISHAPVICSMAWSPWVIMLFLRAQQKEGLSETILLGMALAASLLGGQPQALIYVIPACLILAPAFAPRDGDWSWWRPLLVLGKASAIALLLASVQVIPTLERTFFSERASGVADIRQWGCSLAEMPAYFLGDMSIAQRVDKLAFPGTLGLIAAIYCGLWLRGHRTRAWLMIIGLGLVLAWVQGNPLYDLLQHVPIYSHFRAHSRAGIIVAIGAAMLFARMLDEGRDLKWSRLAATTVGLLVGLEVLALAATDRFALGPLAEQDPMSWQLPIITGVLAVALVGVARKKWTAGLLITLLILGGTETILLAQGRNPTFTAREWLDDEYHQILATAGELHDREGGAFVRWGAGLPSSASLLFDLPCPRSYAALSDLQLEVSTALLFGPNSPETLAAYGVRWVADRKGWAEREGLKLRSRVGDWGVYENPAEISEAYMPRQIVPGDLNDALQLLRSGESDPREVVVLSRELIGASFTRDPDASVQVISSSEREIVLQTRSETPLVVIAERGWSPQWDASVSGQKVDCLRAHLLLLAAPVPPGVHEVRFTYETAIWRPTAISVLTLIAVILILVRERRRRFET